VQVIVYGNRLHASLACEVERTFAIEIIGQVDTGRGSRAVSSQTVINVDVTVFSLVTRRTNACVSLSLVDTGGSILAGSSSTSIILILATNAGVVLAARAVEAVTQVSAGSSVHAWVTNASLGRCLAPFAISTRWAGTEEVLEEVNTECIVLTSGWVTLLVVLLTSLAHPSNGASALEIPNEILALSSITAGICLAVVDIGLATFTLITVSAFALKSVVQIKALKSSRWIAGPSAALVLLHLASSRTNKAWPAGADKAVNCGLTGATILAWFVNAEVTFVLAIGSGEARLTDTGVAINLIQTLALVLTRVACTVLNVDVTLVSCPAGLANTLVSEELVNAHASDAGIVCTEVDLSLTTLASESVGT